MKRREFGLSSLLYMRARHGNWPRHYGRSGGWFAAYCPEDRRHIRNVIFTVIGRRLRALHLRRRWRQ